VNRRGIVMLVAALAALILFNSAYYEVSETSQVIVTQFGDPIGEPVTSPGLHMKVPFIQKANSFDKRFLAARIRSRPRTSASSGSILTRAGGSSIR